MAIGWLSILKAVPWTDVVSNAPKVADGAKKLWETVARKSAGNVDAPTGSSPSLPTDAQTLVRLEAGLIALADQVGQLQKEMIDSSQLLKALAEQNAQLVRRVYWLSRALLVVGLIAVLGLLGLLR